MPKCKKSIKNEVCHGCLTAGRRLVPIAEFWCLYKKLMEDVIRDQKSHKKAPLMCWECRSVLRNVRKFQERAKEAYESLFMRINLGDNMIQKPHLSTVTTCSENQSDCEVTDDYIKNGCKDRIQIEDNIDLKQNEEVKIEFNYVERIKEEKDAYDDIKLESGCVDIESITEEAEYTENDHDIEADVKEEIGINEMDIKSLNHEIKLEKTKLSRKAKYKVIRRLDYESFTKLCSAVKIDDKERQRCIQLAKLSEDYLNKSFQCDKCIFGYNKKQKYENHLKIYHSESNPYECELCGARFSTKLSLVKHMKGHSYKHVCSLCDYESLNKRKVFVHLTQAHRITYQCRECGLRFQDKYKEFYNHYNTMHKRFVCDYCGFGGTSKQRLINHIRVNHCENICKYCNKKYAVYHSMTRHIALRHTKEVTEESYCVECNMQFDNIMLYTRHLKTSVRHKPKIVFPCTECPNVYAKKTAMTNHYKYIHLQKTNYYCDKCSRYFLNGFRLRTHIATYHNNIQAPKNKICSYCGRGFVTNRILDNHIRTHTGERPFACSHCTATFAQKSALVTHARAIHKVMMRYATKE